MKIKTPKWITFWYNSIHNYVNFYVKRKQAMILHKTHGIQFHVVPSDKGLMVVSSRWIDAYNKAAKKNRTHKIDAVWLMKYAYYSTPVRGIREAEKKLTFMEKMIELFSKEK